MNLTTKARLSLIAGGGKLTSVQTKSAGCEICREAFNIFLRREHQCRRCSRRVCGDCSRFQEKVVSSLTKTSTIQRVCGPCKEEIDYQKQTMYWMKTSWGKSSSISQTWIKHFKLATSEVLKTQYESDRQHFKRAIQESKEELLEVLEKIKEDLVACFFNDSYFNYSLLDWIYHSQKGLKREEIFDTIKIVIGTFLWTHKDIGYGRDLFLLTVFLLTMSNDATVYAIIQQIYMELVPQYVLPREQSSPDIMEIAQSAVQTSLAEFQQNFKAVRFFMEQALLKYNSCFFINLVNFQVCYTIFNEFSEKGSFSVIESYFNKICLANLKVIRKGLDDMDQITNEIVRNTDIKILKQLKLEEKPQEEPVSLNVSMKDSISSPTKLQRGSQITPVPPQRQPQKRLTQHAVRVNTQSDQHEKEPISKSTKAGLQPNKSLTSVKMLDLLEGDAPKVTMFTPSGAAGRRVMTSLNDSQVNFDTQSNAPSQLVDLSDLLQDNTMMEETNEFLDNLITDQKNLIAALTLKLKQRDDIHAGLLAENNNLNAELANLDAKEVAYKEKLKTQMDAIRLERENFAKLVAQQLQAYNQQNI